MKIFVNFLTLVRIVSTFILPIIWQYLNPLMIVLIVGVILLTDFFDGKFARKFKVQTLFGSIMDTVADKIFGIVIVLIVAHTNPLYYIIAILELLIALVSVYAALRGAKTKSSFIGRSKMWLLGITTLIGIMFTFESNIQNYMNIDLYNILIENKDLLILSSLFLCVGAELMVIIDYSYRFGKELRMKKVKVNYQLKNKASLKKALFDTNYYLEHKNQSIYESLFE